MKKFVIEREMPGIHCLKPAELRSAANASNTVLARLAPRVQWMHSYVTKDRTFCVYLADGEDAIYEHARLSGYPANRISEVTGIIDPATAE
jgi:hypothetical protein